jgi:hypothetical protein
MRAGSVAALALIVALAGCRRLVGDEDAGTRDGGPSLPADGGRADGGGGADAGMPSDAGPPPASAPSAAETLSLGIGAAVALTAPLRGQGEMLHDRRDLASDTEARMRVEDAVATSSIVTDGTCVTFTWGTGLSATITFDGCVLEMLGTTLDGSIGPVLTLTPTTFSVSFADLVIGGISFDGDVSLTIARETGTLVYGMTIAADLTFTALGATSTIATTGLELLVSDMATASVTGPIALTAPGLDVSGTLDALTWETGNCHPTSGTFTYMDPMLGLTVVIRALPETPTTGLVELTVGSFTSRAMLLEPCGT